MLANFSAEPAKIRGGASARGSIILPGDKSISHRALVLALVGGQPLTITNLNRGRDCLHTLLAVQELGLRCHFSGNTLQVDPTGSSWTRSQNWIYAGNSGTTARLIMGLAGWLKPRGSIMLYGDKSLSQRPMARICEYLTSFGIRADFAKGDGLPVSLTPRKSEVKADHHLKVASAQLKSAMLLAALGREKAVRIRQEPTRDHTELMLMESGAVICRRGNELSLEPGVISMPSPYQVVGDISTGAFWAGAAALGGSVTLCRTGINPHRRGFLDILAAMGCQVTYTNRGYIHREEVADVEVRGGALRAAEIAPHQVPGLIDELPLLAAVAMFARGTTRVRGAGELKTKESNRLHAIVKMVEAFGGRAVVTGDSFEVRGQGPLRPGEFWSHDHRLVMAAAVAALGIEGISRVGHPRVTDISSPGFWQQLAVVCPGALISV